MEFIPCKNKETIQFQCSTNMQTTDIVHDINKYFIEHNEIDMYADRTEMPVYFKRYTFVKDTTIWDK